MVFEEGYRYKIIKNTIEEDNSPPIIGNFNSWIREGLTETITIYAYGIVLIGLNFITDKSHGIAYSFFFIIAYK